MTEAVKPYFDVVWANDISAKKAAVYEANHGSSYFRIESIEKISGTELPEAEISWASFPCQDLSLAGAQAGLTGKRSGLVWEWLRIYDEMPVKPRIMIAENVVGLLSSSGGNNYRSLHLELVNRGFQVGAMVVDAASFLPQSRPRVFIVACDEAVDTSEFTQPIASWPQTRAVLEASSGLPGLVFWKLPPPTPERRKTLSDLVEWDAQTDSAEVARRNIAMIAPQHRTRLATEFAEIGRVAPGYKRTRNGKPVLELRFDGIAGCLRTPEGGSSRQLLVLGHRGALTTRLLTARETARLMGAPERYSLPPNYNDAYKAMGDAVAVPVARFLAKYLIQPLSHAIEIQARHSTLRLRSAQ